MVQSFELQAMQSGALVHFCQISTCKKMEANFSLSNMESTALINNPRSLSSSKYQEKPMLIFSLLLINYP